MSFLKELTDKGATIAWSNVAAHPSLIALGTKDSGGGSGFEDHGGELELHKLDFSQEGDAAGAGGGPGAGTLLGKVKTTARFATLAWSEMATKQAEYPYGLIAGGMGDGTVNVWDPAKLVANHPQPQVASVARHNGPVTGLSFNPHKSSSHLLASGGADSEVFIIALDRPDAPTVFVPGPKPNTSRHTAEVTKVAWNSQVSHIMATAAQNGSCIVWDLKQKKPWCELKDPNRAPITDVAWNPDQGQHLVTASGDDSNPVLKLWDLRSSTTLPLATLSGHTEGVLSVAWCPYDASLLMSCAKDNRTLLWDLFSLKPVYELPPGAGEQVPQESTQMFGGYGKTAQRRYQVSWSPHIPAVVSTCSFDRKVQLFSMNGAATSNGRAPKWHRRPAGASFAFGGRLVSFSAKGGDPAAAAAAGGAAGHQAAGAGAVKISSVKEDAAFVSASRRFEEAMASKGFRGFCQEKEDAAATAHERRVWQFMQVIFEKNARNQLLAHLGFDGETVARQAAEFVAASGGTQQNGGSSTANGGSPKAGGGSIFDDESEGGGGILGDSELADAMDGVALDETKLSKSSGDLFSGDAPSRGGTMPSNSQPLSKAAEAVIKRSLLVGNFEAAVQCCMSTGNMADAMLLASCGGADLWAKTQAMYFARESQQRPFLKVVNAIIKSELGGLVAASDLGQWQETLAILSTYAKQEEFPTLCEALASRLETEAGDRKSANLCYMCAVKVPKTVEMWAEELRAANAAVNGGTDTKALQEFVEKVSVFTQEPNDPPGEEVSAIFAEYAGILASEGETETALKYIKGQGHNGAVLQDRLFHSAPHAAGTPSPPFPFERVHVGASPQSVVGGGGGQGAGVRGGVRGANGGGGGGGGSATVRADPRATAAAAVAGATAGGEAPLPPGWTQMVDPSRNIPYYCNMTTGETQWERPPPPPSAAAAAAPTARTARSPHAPRMPQASAAAAGSSPYNRGNPAAVAAAATPSASPVKPGYRGGPQHAGMGPGAFQRQPAAAAQPQPQPQPQQRQYNSMANAAAQYAGPAAAMPASSYQHHQQTGGRGPPGGAAGGGGMVPSGGFPSSSNSGIGMPGGSGLTSQGSGAASAPAGRGMHQGMRERGGGGRGGGVGPPGGMTSSSASPVAAPVSTASAASVAATEPAPPPPSDAQSQAVVSALNGMLGALSETPLGPREKKMLGDVTKAVGILFAKMGRGQVEQETLAKVGHFVDSLQARDIKTANAIQQGLANSAWASHKDWLKGLKYLSTLVLRLA